MNSIFTHFIARGNSVDDRRRLAYASWFTESIPLSEFDGDERLFCEYIDYSVKLGAPINYKYLQIWLNTELKEILHKTKVKVTGCETLSFDDPISFETIARTTADVLSDDFKVLETMEADLADFKVDVSAYFSERKSERLTNALASTFDMLNKTNSSDEASEYALDAINTVKDVYDVTKLEDIEDDTDEERLLNRHDSIKISDSGLPAIDKDSEGLWTKQLLGIEAQPGTGKTRLAIGSYSYRALTIYKKNVLYLNLEQDVEEIEAMLVACHVFWLFNIQISDKMILRHTVPEELQSYVEAARIDLFESGKYGKFVAKNPDLYVETFITKLRTWDKLLGPFDLICIDYMGLIESKPIGFNKELSEYEIIKTAFKQFKRYVRKSNKAGIAVSQFNREGVNAGKADKEISTDMAQGGMAVYRNTDYNIAMSMTETMRVQQKRRFSQPKVRSSAGFPSFICDTRLGFCYFKQVVQQTV